MVRALTARTTAVALLLTSCGSEDSSDLTRLWIAPDLADCTGGAEQECLQVTRTEDGPFELFYDPIVGFSFEATDTSSMSTTSTIHIRIWETANGMRATELATKVDLETATK